MLISDRIPTSTAMFLGARFPIISPIGRLEVDYKSPRTVWPSGVRRYTSVLQRAGLSRKELHLVDGGYFDDSATLALNRLLVTALADNQRVYVLSLTNDPGRQGLRQKNCSLVKTVPAQPTLFSAPLVTLDRVRSSLGEANRRILRDKLQSRFKTVSLVGCDNDRPLPLGWSLSKTTRKNMDAKADELLRDDHYLSNFIEDAFVCSNLKQAKEYGCSHRTRSHRVKNNFKNANRPKPPSLWEKNLKRLID